jgi:hypothetical protein
MNEVAPVCCLHRGHFASMRLRRAFQAFKESSIIQYNARQLYASMMPPTVLLLVGDVVGDAAGIWTFGKVASKSPPFKRSFLLAYIPYTP